MLVSLPLIFLALAVHLSASKPDAKPSASSASQRPGTILINGRLFEERSLLPIDVADHNEIRDSRRKRAILQEALGPVLPRSLIEIAGNYSCASRSRQFAEELYAELWVGKTDLLRKELYDSEKNALKEPHHFWKYLAGGAERVVVFVHMLWEIQSQNPKLKEGLKKLALLVGEGVPPTAYFVGWYADGRIPFPLENASFDEWPQVLVEDLDRVFAPGRTGFVFVAALEYVLMQSDLERAARCIFSLVQWVTDDRTWLTVFHSLYVVKPDLVRIFFDAAMLADRRQSMLVLKSAAPAAMSVDPTLSKYLVEWPTNSTLQCQSQSQVSGWKNWQTMQRLAAMCTCGY